MQTTRKILVLSRRDHRPDYDTAISLVKTLNPSKHGIVYENCFLEDLAFVFDGQELSVTDHQTGRNLREYDGVFLIGWFKLRKHEDVALAVACYMQAIGKKVLNSEARHNRSRSKLSQAVLCALHKIPQPSFAYIGDSTQLEQVVAKSNLRYPMIVKSTTGSRGRHNFLVDHEADLRAALAEMPTKAVIAQRFIANDGDYRLLVMGDTVRLIIHRQAQNDSHLNNTSQGGRGVVLPADSVDADMLADAVKIAHLLGREITGVDMIVERSSGQYFFLEANNMPQLSTGSVVDQKARALDDFFSAWIN
jgi:glutathione synthase/RimK-type ligase-like ATP-grasp enzyme